MRPRGCRRCRLLPRRASEEDAPPCRRRAAPMYKLFASGCCAAPPLGHGGDGCLLGGAPQARSPCPPSALRAPPPLRSAALRCPGALSVPSPFGSGGAVAPWSVGRRFAPPAFVGCRSWCGCAAPPPSRPKSLVASPSLLRLNNHVLHSIYLVPSVSNVRFPFKMQKYHVTRECKVKKCATLLNYV